MNRRVMAVTAAAVMSMSSFAVPAMADEEEAVSIQISAPIMSMDPLIGGDSTNVAVISNTMEGLFVVDADGQIQNGLCDSYEVSDDQKTYTFHIRDNAKWSDGTPVTAQDFGVCLEEKCDCSGGITANLHIRLRWLLLKTMKQLHQVRQMLMSSELLQLMIIHYRSNWNIQSHFS
ncbi:MAG: ABC transporter substrate-binding protein [Lachnospiraceae bacterium]